MGFAEWQLLQQCVRGLGVGHIQDEDDRRPVFQRIPLVDLAIEIELRGLANLGRQNALNLRHVRARGEGADGQNLGGRRLRHRCLSNGTVGGNSEDRGGSQISERMFDHGRTFLKRVDVRFGSFTSFALSRRVRFAPKSGHSANARVYEYTAYDAAENKSLEIKTLRPRRGRAVRTARSWRGIVPITHLAREGRMTVIIRRRELLAAL